MGGRRLRIALLAVAVVVAGAGVALRSRAGGDDAASATTVPTTLPTTTVPATIPGETTLVPPPDLAAIAPTGQFVVAAGASGPVGAGPPHVYTVEVEAGLPLDPVAVAGLVDAIVADGRGWTHEGAGFQRTADPAAAQLRVVVATPATTDQLCAPLRTGGRFSCFEHGVVVLNASRWFDGAAAESGLGLDDYRIAAVNHELGHAIGHPDVACPGPGLPAPVMVPQSSSIGACTANAWPYP